MTSKVLSILQIPYLGCMKGICGKVFKKCISLVNLVTQLHVYKLWLPPKRQSSIKSLAFILITLRKTAGNHESCTRNLYSLLPQTDDKVISGANSPGQYFFPKHRYEWIIAILNCLMIFFPFHVIFSGGLYFYHLANSYWQSDIHCRIKHSGQSIKHQLQLP